MNENLHEKKQSGWSVFMSSLKGSLIYKIFQFIVSSAAVSFLITVVIFVVEQKEEAERTDKMISNLHIISDNLLEVQNSVSTRYLGIFPDYLQEVNVLLEGMNPKDSVVIFEDVLYYGILSKPENFIRMNHMLLSHADKGGDVTIAYYGVEGRTFHRMIREQRIAPEFFADMDADMDAEMRKGARANGRRALDDSAICEKYFKLTNENDPASFAANVDKYLKPLSGYSLYDDELSHELEDMYARIDSVKTVWLGKPKSEIRFSDYENMYKGISYELIKTYEAHGVELIPLDEYLTMTCWLVSGQAVLAFPSKYATEEIGFYSKDPAFSDYIRTMLSGVRGYYGQ